MGSDIVSKIVYNLLLINVNTYTSSCVLTTARDKYGIILVSKNKSKNLMKTGFLKRKTIKVEKGIYKL